MQQRNMFNLKYKSWKRSERAQQHSKHTNTNTNTNTSSVPWFTKNLIPINFLTFPVLEHHKTLPCESWRYVSITFWILVMRTHVLSIEFPASRLSRQTIWRQSQCYFTQMKTTSLVKLCASVGNESVYICDFCCGTVLILQSIFLSIISCYYVTGVEGGLKCDGSPLRGDARTCQWGRSKKFPKLKRKHV